MDATVINPCGDLGGVESNELAEFAERDPTLLDQPADEARRHAEAIGDLIDVEQLKVMVRCGHVVVKAVDGYQRDMRERPVRLTRCLARVPDDGEWSTVAAAGSVRLAGAGR